AIVLGWQMTAAVLLIPIIPLAIMTAIYTAFLFGQAEGRDLWQSPLMAPHLLVQAIIAGSSVLLFPALTSGSEVARLNVGMTRTLMTGLVLNLFIIIFGEILTRHGTTD